MSFDIIIPARYSSTRLPGKPLIDLQGKTLIERVFLATKNSQAERIIIATDDVRIQTEVHRFGGEVCMTSSSHRSGTDRLAEVVEKMDIAQDRIIVNVQGDEPFIEAALIDQVAGLLIQDEDLNMSTACHKLDHKKESEFASINNPNVVKVVLNDVNEALYFSRSAIPYPREEVEELAYFQHMGIYAYRSKFIQKFTKLPVGNLEQSESLEQLRVLEAGHRIKLVQYTGQPSVGIDTPEDVKLAIARLSQ